MTISRCSNNYGPYHFPEKLIPLMIVNALNDKPLPVYGEGLNVRDWLYVEDHCKAIDLLFTMDVLVRFTTLVDTTRSRTSRLLRLSVRNLVSHRALLLMLGIVRDMICAMLLILLRFTTSWAGYPKLSFEDGIKKTIKWYLENREWWENIISGEYQSYYEQMYGNRFEDIRNSVKGAI